MMVMGIGEGGLGGGVWGMVILVVVVGVVETFFCLLFSFFFWLQGLKKLGGWLRRLVENCPDEWRKEFVGPFCRKKEAVAESSQSRVESSPDVTEDAVALNQHDRPLFCVDR